MRILVTSDWQCEYENLDVCRQVVAEIQQLIEDYSVDALVHCGDFKRQYSPVDVRVTNFAMRTISKITKNGFPFFILLGNHDRVGMYVDKENWLPTLRKAGAQAFDDPTVVELGGIKLHFLPFRTSSVLLGREAQDLAKKASPETSALFFHCDLQSAQYNVLTKSQDSFSPDKLRPEKYMTCVGGHIHLQQKLRKNVWYVGSPFCTDWGEANQQKGYLLIDFDAKKTYKLLSGIPGWYDPSWPGFDTESAWFNVANNNGWKGTRVRLHVPCAGVSDVAAKLESARAKAEENYPNADLVLIPEIQQVENKKFAFKATDTDKEKVQAYVKATLPDKLRKREDRIVGYMLEVLYQVGGAQRASGRVKFHGFDCQNVLSYKKLNVVFSSGLTVVTGENKDRPGKSNGSGKTSYLQPLAIALFGKTFKEQKHDAWARRHAGKDDPVQVLLTFTDMEGRTCQILRTRRPGTVRLLVNSKEITADRPERTQKRIEQLTGYTWETLANAIYIDQARAHVLLSGKEAERKAFLARLQNLDRFAVAQKAVKAENEAVVNEICRLSDSISELYSSLEALRTTLKETKLLGGSLALAEKRYSLAKRDNSEAQKKLEELTTKNLAEISVLKVRNDAEQALRDQHHEWNIEARTKVNLKEHRISSFERLKNTCTTCGSILSKTRYKEKLQELKDQVRGLKKQIEGHQELEEKSRLASAKLEKQIFALESEIENEEKRAQKLAEIREKFRLECEQARKHDEFKQGILRKIRDKREAIEEAELRGRQLGKKTQRLSYVERAFSRDGLPSYLNAQLCPELNKAAELYSELFAQKEIQVLFDVTPEGELDVKVLNAHGGENVNDQSQGEMKIASLITSFAVRHAAPRTNILILDEPAEGLDTASARQFAKGLREIVPKFGTVLLTSHNQHVLGELADALQVHVVKKGGISRVEETS